MKDKDILDLLGLTDKTISLTLESDMLNLMDDFVKENEKHEERKREFMQLFKECFDDICVYMEKDPKRRVSVNCFTCIKGLDLRDKYGKSNKSK